MYEKLNAFTLDWATDWAALFGRAAPLILEIGFGRGAFLLHLARTRPHANIVGLEINNQSLVMTERAIAREGLHNVRVVHARAEMALRHLFAPATLTEVHINFPDPWFKLRHSHNRLVQRPTVDAIVSRMVTGGRLFAATDILAYAQQMAAVFNATPQLDNPLATDWADALDDRVTTKYEARAAAQGRTCCYFVRERNSAAAPDLPVIKDLPMPHLTFTAPSLTLDAVYTHFTPTEARHTGDVIVHLTARYRSEHTILFEAFIKEPTVTQTVALILQQRRSGEWSLMLSPLGHPRPTAGVHRAVGEIEAWLFTLAPDAALVQRSLQQADG